MGGLYDILESYRRQNNPNLNYEGLFEERVYPSIPQDPPFVEPTRSFMSMSDRSDFGVPRQDLGILPFIMNPKFKGVSDLSIIDETGDDQESQEYIDMINKNKSFFNPEKIKSGIINLGLAAFNPFVAAGSKILGGISNFFDRPGVQNFLGSSNFQEFLDKQKADRERQQAPRNPSPAGLAALSNVYSNIGQTRDRDNDRGGNNQGGGFSGGPQGGSLGSSLHG